MGRKRGGVGMRRDTGRRTEMKRNKWRGRKGGEKVMTL